MAHTKRNKTTFISALHYQISTHKLLALSDFSKNNRGSRLTCSGHRRSDLVFKLNHTKPKKCILVFKFIEGRMILNKFRLN